jgi:hypothetical protein
MSRDIVVMRAVGMAKRKKLSSGVQRRTSDEPYNVDYFARKHDISFKQARELMRKIGRDRDKLNEPQQGFFASRSETTAANASS